MRKTIILFATILLFASCEEEVILDLKKIDHQIVVEAALFNPSGNVSVALSYSQSFYDTSKIEMITDAVVSLTGPGLGKIDLLQVAEGVYHYHQLPLKANQTYTLIVQTKNRRIEAQAMMPAIVKIESVAQVPNPFSGPDSLNLFTSYFDIPGEDNFFRLKVNKKGRVPTSEYFLVDDTFGKNGLITSPVYYKNFAKGDTAIVELFHFNRATWNYLNGLSENRGGSFNSVSPENPISNMPEGVLGYFAGYGYWADTVVVR